ncbi:ankyrin repeat protein, putative [Bodo saltans]|uniref:Ankyrin repeat protein, putative n=1 Tax=Bodo saltans TaxID=75058 RepID=A0A0S4IZ37_BODSA|nr:ankyrin repeat protein, putative [Bodo saltans]|eukprot:CUG62705.1 ankyrin repeat protein, putative [Bodo saltans]
MDIRLNNREIIVAACQEKPELLAQLVGDDLSVAERVTMLWQACAMGDIGLVEYLTTFRESCNPNFQRQSDGVSCLYIAAQNGHDEACKILVDNGADVNLSRNSRATPLFIATQRNHSQVVSALLVCGANTEIENDQQCTPFVLACNMGHTSIAILLLEHGCRFSHRATGKSPLLWCKQERRYDTLAAISRWISTRYLDSMARAVEESLIASRWAAWVANVSRIRSAKDQVARDMLDAAMEKQANLLQGGPLPPLSDLMEFEFSGRLHKPTIEITATPMRSRPSLQFSSPPQLDQHVESPRSQRKRNVLSIFSPSTQAKEVTRPVSKLQPSTSKTYDRQQKIRELLDGSVDHDHSIRFANALCTQHFR